MRILLLLILSFSALGATSIRKNFKIQDKSILFLEVPKKMITISEGCLNKDRGQLRCQAFDALKKVREIKLTSEDMQIGFSPGAVLCYHKDIKGRTVVAVDDFGVKTCLCHFDDGSYVKCTSLTAYSIKPDR